MPEAGSNCGGTQILNVRGPEGVGDSVGMGVFVPTVSGKGVCVSVAWGVWVLLTKGIDPLQALRASRQAVNKMLRCDALI